LGEAAGDALEISGGAKKEVAKKSSPLAGIDIGLMLYFLFWYVGNYYVSSGAHVFPDGPYTGWNSNFIFLRKH
jgi:hypothetical protein